MAGSVGDCAAGIPERNGAIDAAPDPGMIWVARGMPVPLTPASMAVLQPSNQLTRNGEGCHHEIVDKWTH